MDQLQINGAEYAISFPVRNDTNHLVYYLIFATSGPHSYDCFKKLKEALNRASVETEELKFSGYKVRLVYFRKQRILLSIVICNKQESPPA